MTISQYLENLNRRYKTGITTEHSFRGDLQQLVESIAPGVLATNEPIRIACGAPDFIVTKKNIPLGYIEAKDIGVDLTNKNLKEQFDRYRHALDNLILTDYLDFHFYKTSAFVTSIRIAKTEGNKIIPVAEKLDEFTALLKDFCAYTGQSIKSSKTLAEMMAGKARMLADVIENSLNSDEENSADSSLKEQMKAFKDILIHDITAKEFSDIYAQTVAYGMFAARLHDHSLDNFTRQEAAELIPKSNPFLRKLFGYIAGPDIDERIVWIVDALADIFRATDVAALLKNFGKATQQQDPVIHFYETFLAAYDPALRKARGVWYTPEPVVNFIVRAVDDILKTEFNLPDGLADRSKTKVKVKAFTKGKDKQASAKEVETEVEVHKVQILDPATGTGTFLAEVIKQIYKKFEGQQGLWSSYVNEHLIPRLNGFELLMASYAMAHLKLDLLLTETGYTPSPSGRAGVGLPQRLRVYLTNSLEEHHADTGTLFASWLSTEANEANHIKRDTPVMVVMGNPPYSGESANKGEWIMELMEDYKKEPGGKERLNERNPKWINDDYVKFLRYGQYFIEKNGEGVLAFINAHGFLENPTFRGMRWNLLNTYDKIYILNLHGNSKKKEIAPDGSADVNVFDIQQGVSINLFIKTGEKKANELGKVLHFDLYGKRELKYDFLFENSINKIPYVKLENIAPNYYFVQKNFSSQKIYDKGFQINELYPLNNVGIVTAKDEILINNSKENLIENIEIHFKKEPDKSNIQKISYRPFDDKFIYYDVKLIERAREKVMQHFLKGENVGLNYIRPSSSNYEFSIFISKYVTDQCSAGNKSAGAGISFIAPMYLYPESTIQKSLYEKQERTPNLNKEIVEKIAKGLGLEFTDEKTERHAELVSASHQGNLKQVQVDAASTFAPIDILDYIYAVLHSPTYREKYKEFLKIDFPRVPYPKNANTFWQLVKLGEDMRQIHLLESDVVNKPVTKFPIDGDNAITQIPKYVPTPHNKETGVVQGDVHINETQYFKNVPLEAWRFYIGGYQPAQKWLKDRKGRTLNFDDIVHYQKIIVALNETDRLMKEIDTIKFE